MKKVLWSTIVLLGLFGMYSCNEEVIPPGEGSVKQQELETLFTGDDIIPGQLIIKLAKEPAEVKVVQTRSGESQIETGLKTIDEICASIGASSMRRVFRPSGKFEARSCEAGLHLWYIIEFPEEIPLTRTALDFSNSEDIALVEPVFLIQPPTEEITEINPTLQNIQTRSSAIPFNDPLLNQQWNYESMANFSFISSNINLFDAWPKQLVIQI